jgi:hypothetical protein
MIGLGGLLLFAVPVLDLWVGLEKSKKVNLDMRQNLLFSFLLKHCMQGG